MSSWPITLVSPLPEAMKNITPAKTTHTGMKLRISKLLLLMQFIMNSQMIAVYCMPIATAEEVMVREKITLRPKQQ